MAVKMVFSPFLFSITVFLIFEKSIIFCLEKSNITLECIPSEHKALLRFKGSLSDPSGRLSSWITPNDEDCCGWEGVECDEDTRHVIGLDLRNRGTITDDVIQYRDTIIHGNTIDSSVLELKYLSHLDLSLNDFQHSSIPAFVGSMKQLRYLNLSRAGFSGTVPRQLGNLSSLRTLDLGGSFNHLDGNDLGFSYGKLKVDDFMWATNLSSLEYLDLSYVNLNRTKDLIQVLDTLPFISVLRLSGIGLDITNLPHFQNMTTLSVLDLSYNSLNHKCDWISDLVRDKCHLKVLNLMFNQFYGNISGVFKNLSGGCGAHSLEILCLVGNELVGHLPEEVGELRHLTELHVSRNRLSGSIPFSLGNLRALRALYLSENQLSGGIPISLGRLSNLVSLDLSRNHISGNLPDYWVNFPSLTFVGLSYNQLSGDIPNSISGAFSLTSFHLNNNSLTGKLPFSLKNCTRLRILDVGDNELYGDLPEWIGNMYRMQILRLRNNNFSGAIPSVYCQLSSLQIMDIAHNLLTGNIPRCIGNFSGMVKGGTVEGGIDANVLVERFLENLNVMMKGVMREYTTRVLGNLVNLDLSSNQLVGEIPSELTSLSGLVGLNLSHNHIGGEIPGEIGDMQSLMSLDLSNNNLYGIIPDSLSNLTSLSHMNLSNNNLSGRIPTGPQLQTLIDPSSYEGNFGLCGAPLPKKCHVNSETHSKFERDCGNTMVDKFYMYAFIVSGFATGLCGYFGILIFKRRWRIYLFRCMDTVIGKMLGRQQ